MEGEVFPAVRGTGAVPEAPLSAMGETRAQGPGEDEDRENYAELLMSSAQTVDKFRGQVPRNFFAIEPEKSALTRL